MTDTITAELSEILLVEDSPSDAALTRKALARGRVVNRLHHVRDGVECMQFLRREGQFGAAPRPDLILLDLNMPRKDGREVLREVKADEDLARIPVVVLTTSGEEADIIAAYDAHTNAYIVKPVDLKKFFDVVTQIDQFWFQIVKLPAR
jgi:two-component system response regulator